MNLMKKELVASKEEFIRYLRLQKSGICNMLADTVQSVAEISKEAHADIIIRYDQYIEQYGVTTSDVDAYNEREVFKHA